MRFKLVEDSLFTLHNQNPRGEDIDDCVLRSISFAYNKPYDEVHKDFEEYNMLPERDGKNWYQMRYNIATLIAEYGYKEYYDANSFPHDIDETVADVCRDYPQGTWIVCCPEHLTVVKNGKIYDTFNPSRMQAEEIWRVD